MARRTAFCAGVAAALSLCCGAAQAQFSADQTVIEGSYDFVADRLSPDPRPAVRTQQTFRIVLSGRNSIDESWDARTARGRVLRQSRRARVLGGEGEGGAQWRVAGPNRLMRIADLSQSRTTLVVTVLRDRTCAVSVSYRLKPGFREYRYRRLTDRTWALYGQPRAENITCLIQ
jgi:hypothetical protein